MTKTKYYMRWFFGILFFPLWILIILVKTYFEVKEEKRQKLIKLQEKWDEWDREYPEFEREYEKEIEREVNRKYNNPNYGCDTSSAVCGDCGFF